MKDKVFSRYINKMYPELLKGNLYFNNGEISGLYSMSYDNCYIGSILLQGGGEISSMNISHRYLSSLKVVFGDEYEELLLKWFNKEHEVMLYSLLGNDCGVMYIND